MKTNIPQYMYISFWIYALLVLELKDAWHVQTLSECHAKMSELVECQKAFDSWKMLEECLVRSNCLSSLWFVQDARWLVVVKINFPMNGILSVITTLPYILDTPFPSNVGVIPELTQGVWFFGKVSNFGNLYHYNMLPNYLSKIPSL